MLFAVDAPATVVDATTKTMRTRLKAAKIDGGVVVISHREIRVLVVGRQPFLKRLLEERGLVRLQILPHGSIYDGRLLNPIARASVCYDFSTPTICFVPRSPSAFRRFTQAHLKERLGIFVDGRLLDSAELVAPITEGQIAGTFSDAEARLIAVVLGNPPLPANVRLVGSIRH